MGNKKIAYSGSMKISLYQLIAVLMVFFATSGALIYKIIPMVLMRNSLALLLLAMVILGLNGHNVDKKTFFMVVFLIIISLYNNYTIKNMAFNTDNGVKYISFIAMLLLCCFASVKIYWVKTYLKLSLPIYYIYGAATIIFIFTPDFYKENIVPLFSFNTDRLIAWYDAGCMPGLTSHYSTNGMFLSIGILIIFSRMLLFKRKKIDYFFFFGMVIALICTGKRAHTLFVLAAMLLLYYYNSGKKIESRIVKIIGVSIVVFIVLYISYKYLEPFKKLVIRFIDAFDSEDVTNHRVRWWKLAIQYFKSNPVLGIGWGQFYTLCGRVTRYYANTHNVYLQLLCETGIVGFTVYMWWIIKTFFTTVKLFKNSRSDMSKSVDEEITDKEKRFYLGFSLSYQTFFILYCFTGNPLYDKETFIPYFVCCAITIYYSKNKLKQLDYND